MKVKTSTVILANVGWVILVFSNSLLYIKLGAATILLAIFWAIIENAA